MKNIHLIPTDKPSRLHLWTDENCTSPALCELEYSHTRNTQNIYITNNEEIKEGDWMYYKHFGEDIICKYNTWNGQNTNVNEHKDYYSKIILTTDSDLIKDGVQAIDDEFLEWFVKNPNCEEIGVKKYENGKYWTYEINIPQEKVLLQSSIDGEVIWGENKQETREEVVERLFNYHSNNTSLAEGHYDYMMDKEDFKQASDELVKWQQERMYSEKEVLDLLSKRSFDLKHKKDFKTTLEWFEQFKKK